MNRLIFDECLNFFHSGTIKKLFTTCDLYCSLGRYGSVHKQENFCEIRCVFGSHKGVSEKIVHIKYFVEITA